MDFKYIVIIVLIALFLLFSIAIIFSRFIFNKSKTPIHGKVTLESLQEIISQVPFLNNFPEKVSTISVTGMCFSGGGSRAACATWGILQSLNSVNLLNNKFIAYISCNSGSTWPVLSSLYYPIYLPINPPSSSNNISEPTSLPTYQIDDILGQYTEPEFLDFTKQVSAPLFGYNIVNSNILTDIFSYDFEQNITSFNPEFWLNSIGNSFFKKYGLYGKDYGYITAANSMDYGYKYLDIQNPSRYYIGICARDNMPLPISLQSFKNINSNEYIPFDSSPYSSGFLDISKGRVASMAIGQKIQSSNGLLGTFEKSSNMWSPYTMSGTSSTAFGKQFLDSGLQDFLPIYDITTTPENSIKGYLVDGYLVDNTSLISLLCRGVNRVVMTISNELDQLFTQTTNSNVKVGDYIYIKNVTDSTTWNKLNQLNLQDTVGYVTAVFDTNMQVQIIGPRKQVTTISYDCASILSIGDLAQLFGNVLDPNAGNQYLNYSSMIRNMMINFGNTGIMYCVGPVRTVNNPKLSITPNDISILIYALSPYPNFYNKLSQTNRDIILNDGIFPNFCTFSPILNDRNLTNTYKDGYNIQCSQLASGTDVIANAPFALRMTNAQVLMLSSLTGYITKQIIIPYLNIPSNFDIVKGDYSSYIKLPEVEVPVNLPAFIQPGVVEDFVGSAMLNMFIPTIDTYFSQIQKFKITMDKQYINLLNTSKIPSQSDCTCSCNGYKFCTCAMFVISVIFSDINNIKLAINPDKTIVSYTNNTINLTLSLEIGMFINGELDGYAGQFAIKCDTNWQDTPTSANPFSNMPAKLSLNINISIPYSNLESSVNIITSGINIGIDNLSLNTYPPFINTITNTLDKNQIYKVIAASVLDPIIQGFSDQAQSQLTNQVNTQMSSYISQLQNLLHGLSNITLPFKVNPSGVILKQYNDNLTQQQVIQQVGKGLLIAPGGYIGFAGQIIGIANTPDKLALVSPGSQTVFRILSQCLSTKSADGKITVLEYNSFKNNFNSYMSTYTDILSSYTPNAVYMLNIIYIALYATSFNDFITILTGTKP